MFFSSSFLKLLDLDFAFLRVLLWLMEGLCSE